MSQRKRLALIDGHALAFRAFHALREAGLRSSSGEPTYAVFGFAQILLTTLEAHHPEYAAVAFDVGRTFRDDLYADYKAGRAATPEEFHPQLARIKALVTALNLPIYVAAGFEADDVIGTLARQATAADIETLILTGDTDSLQLINDHVRVLLANPYAKGGKTTTLYDEAAVRERYAGLAPAQLADLRGLKGDASDNIPGVKGIGEKGALTLLNQFGTVEALFEQLDLVPNRYKKLLDGQRDAALFSKRLATIVCDVSVELRLADCVLAEYDRTAVIRLFQELELGASSNLIKKLPPLASELAAIATLPPEGTAQPTLFDAATPAGTQQLALFDLPTSTPVAPSVSVGPSFGTYSAITTPEALAALVAALAAAPGFAFDTESTGLRPLESVLVGLSVAYTPGVAFYLPFGHSVGPQLPREQVLAALRPLFEDASRPKYAHNAKFDLELLQGAGINVQGLAFDTMIVAALLGKQRLGLKDLAFYELQLPAPLTPISALIGKGQKQISFAEVPLALATPYAAADADMTLRLTHMLEPQLQQDAALVALFNKIELPLVPVLVAMETAGITLDAAYLGKLGTQLAGRITEAEDAIYAAAGQRFNINSGQQLNAVLFASGNFGLDPKLLGLNKLKSGGYSLTAEVLEQLAPVAPIAAQIVHYRQLSKLKSTYVDALPALVSPQTGRVHTSYNQVGAATGRLSSDSPNLQNIPVRTEEGREIRRAFVAAPGHQFIAADYSQIELRVLAHYTRDPALIATFNEGRDIHAATAARLFGIAQDQVDKQQRRIAKTVIFGIVYGISAFGLAQRLGFDRTTAQGLIDSVFQSFPGLKGYIDTTVQFARTHGYVHTLGGRRRPFPELRYEDRSPRAQAAIREAINTPIQGTAADIMKIAMVNLYRALQERHMATRILLQVHDELILEAPDAEVAAATALVRAVMAGAYPALAVTLGVEVETGLNWEEMH